MAEAVETADGWYVLHDLRHMDWTSWKRASNDEKEAAINDFKQMLKEWDDVEAAEKGSHAVYTVIGQKADLLLMILRPTMDELNEIETAFNKSKLADYMLPAYSYLSVVEISKYSAPKEGPPLESYPKIQARLKPILPKWEHICFYPMDKRREGEDNWYATEKDVRAKLLYEHSKTGRKYAGVVKQIISGSFGFDDWEWGVTLFAHDPLQFKKIVYEMRFDEVSARFGEFGEFFVGNHLPEEKISPFFHV